MTLTARRDGQVPLPAGRPEPRLQGAALGFDLLSACFGGVMLTLPAIFGWIVRGLAQAVNVRV